jgi:cell division septation protein DedD
MEKRMYLRIFYILTLFLAVSLILSACSSSDELGREDDGDSTEFEQVDEAMEPVIPATQAPGEQAEQEAAQKENVEVTVDEDVQPAPPAHQETPPPAATAPQTSEPPQSAPRAGMRMWSVQLGAFRSEAGALELVNQLKQRFNQPVYKNYDTASGLHKVTLGSFAERDQATTFKEEVQGQGYPDAFIVEVTR